MTQKKSVHPGDMLFVSPISEGWCLRWYLIDGREGDDSTAERDTPTLPLSVTPYDFGDEDEATDESIAVQDVREMEAARSVLLALPSTRHSVPDEDADSPADATPYFYWLTKAEAEEACKLAMVAVERLRVAEWAQKALAAGWTPPPDWDDRG